MFSFKINALGEDKVRKGLLIGKLPDVEVPVGKLVGDVG